jgi:hypothetical protein
LKCAPLPYKGYNMSSYTDLDAQMNEYIAERDREQNERNRVWKFYKNTASVILHHTEDLKYNFKDNAWMLNSLRNVCENLKLKQQKYEHSI